MRDTLLKTSLLSKLCHQPDNAHFRNDAISEFSSNLNVAAFFSVNMSVGNPVK